MIINNKETANELKSFQWTNGLKLATPKPKSYYFAVLRVEPSITDEQIKSTSTKITSVKRIIKKSTNTITTTVKISTNDKQYYENIINNRFIMNKYTTYKTSPWEESSKPIQCHKCNKIGHTRLNCRASDPTCALCSQKHEMSTCPNKEKPDLHKCTNCSGQHPAFSKRCHLLTNYGGSRVSKVSSNFQCQGLLSNPPPNLHPTPTAPTPNPSLTSTTQPHLAKNPTSSSHINQSYAKITAQNENQTKQHILTNILNTLTNLLTAPLLEMSSLVAINNALQQISKHLHV